MSDTPRRLPARAGFHVIAKPIGAQCNLQCRYCFYVEKEACYRDGSSHAMSVEVLEAFVRQYISAQDVPVINFAWQGGEPTLLGLDFFRRVVALQEKYAAGKHIENAFQTNGVLLDEEWCSFLARHQFLVGLSIDGPPSLHDAYRVDRGGRPTCERTLRAAERLRAQGVAFNTLTSVHHLNASHPLEVYRFLREMGSGFMQFIPIVERTTAEADGRSSLSLPGGAGRGRVTEWSVEPLEFGRFLCSVFDEWVRADVGRVFVQYFDMALEAWAVGRASVCVFDRRCGRALAVEHDGEVYACDHYVFPAFRLGNILETGLASLVDSAAQAAFGEAKAALPRVCRRCDVLFACRGECPRNRFLPAGEGEPDLNYLCEGYQLFFRHIAPSMRFMAEELRHERPPANVMEWVRHRR